MGDCQWETWCYPYAGADTLGPHCSLGGGNWQLLKKLLSYFNKLKR